MKGPTTVRYHPPGPHISYVPSPIAPTSVNTIDFVLKHLLFLSARALSPPGERCPPNCTIAMLLTTKIVSLLIHSYQGLLKILAMVHERKRAPRTPEPVPLLCVKQLRLVGLSVVKAEAVAGLQAEPMGS